MQSAPNRLLRRIPRAQAATVTGRDLAKLGCAVVCSAALALPAGIVLGRLGSGNEPERSAKHGDAAMRDIFSPSVRTDPFFLDRQREGVEALERYCERSGQSCAEARAARARLDELTAAN